MRKDIAAFTADDNSIYPAFVSVHDEGSAVLVTLRSKQIRNDVKGRNDPGPIAEMRMTWDEWRKMAADAAAYKREV